MTHRFDLHLFHDSFDLGGEFSAPESFGFAHKPQVFFRCFAEIERRLFRKITDQMFGFTGFFEDVVTADFHPAAGGGQTAGEDIHGRGFTGAVGAEKTIDMPFFNGKGQIIHCQKIPIVFGQMFYLNHGGTSFGMENSSGTGTVYPVQYRNRG